ncbi:MAG: 2-amino-4-hydroxy-6-hydroxymethyldihydropteridine diphosphokinase [Gammaproteobacteria bacterium]|nr:2-amino-4-hydroxy-6-hydroxymethyldihydropteridine diphosphokinase [Gammaproteobacteria bacterium]
MPVVYIGLGSNLDNPQQQLRSALKILVETPQLRILADSGLYQSRAMTLPGDETLQPDYINAVVQLETDLLPAQLLDTLQMIEDRQGRVRAERWGARTLDLDILLYDDLQMNSERLTIPHAGIAERDFVLYPLQKIDNTLNIPGRGPLSELVASVSDKNLQYLGEFNE